MSDQNARGQCGPLPQLDLDPNEDADEESEPEKTSPNLRVTPGVGGASPLQCEEKAHNGADEEESAEEIDLLEFLLGSHVGMSSLGVAEEEKHGYECDSAEWEIDPETL